MELDERPRRAGFKMPAEAPPSEGTDAAGRFGCEGKYAFVFSDLKKNYKKTDSPGRGGEYEAVRRR